MRARSNLFRLLPTVCCLLCSSLAIAGKKIGGAAPQEDINEVEAFLQGTVQEWTLVNDRKPQVTLDGVVTAVKLNDKKKKADHDWNIFVLPDATSEAVLWNSYEVRNPGGKIELEIKSGEDLPLTHFDDQHVRAFGWWVEDHGHRPTTADCAEAIGGVAATALGNPIGTVVGGWIGSLLPGLLGGSESECGGTPKTELHPLVAITTLEPSDPDLKTFGPFKVPAYVDDRLPLLRQCNGKEEILFSGRDSSGRFTLHDHPLHFDLEFWGFNPLVGYWPLANFTDTPLAIGVTSLQEHILIGGNTRSYAKDQHGKIKYSIYVDGKPYLPPLGRRFYMATYRCDGEVFLATQTVSASLVEIEQGRQALRFDVGIEPAAASDQIPLAEIDFDLDGARTTLSGPNWGSYSFSGIYSPLAGHEKTRWDLRVAGRSHPAGQPLKGTGERQEHFRRFAQLEREYWLAPSEVELKVLGRPIDALPEHEGTHDWYDDGCNAGWELWTKERLASPLLSLSSSEWSFRVIGDRDGNDVNGPWQALGDSPVETGTFTLVPVSEEKVQLDFVNTVFEPRVDLRPDPGSFEYFVFVPNNHGVVDIRYTAATEVGEQVLDQRRLHVPICRKDMGLRHVAPAIERAISLLNVPKTPLGPENPLGHGNPSDSFLGSLRALMGPVGEHDERRLLNVRDIMRGIPMSAPLGEVYKWYDELAPEARIVVDAYERAVGGAKLSQGEVRVLNSAIALGGALVPGETESSERRSRVSKEDLAQLVANAAVREVPSGLPRVARVRGLDFEAGSARLTPAAIQILDGWANRLTVSKERLIIHAYTDTSGGAEANLSLSAQRANAIRRYLISRRVSEGRLAMRAHGEQAPVLDVVNIPSGLEGSVPKLDRIANRRIEFEILSGDER